ncbi:MAG: polyketide beta-ketoacyl:ACP synthase [Gammaproteobacteria bacterium]|nr:polyketide beta-ketoacyl:ACP synthase [Gammaproteobacteria bacterium]DAC82000.1 TPA_exp: ketosynthase [uncultured Gammaproteobacteria bacterium]
MKSNKGSIKDSQYVITGIGITSAVGQGKADFFSAISQGLHNFDIMRRPGRQYETDDAVSEFLGAEIDELKVPEEIHNSTLRTASLSARVGLVTIHEAWHDAELDGMDSERVGLVVGGSNYQQRESFVLQNHYKDRPNFLRPTYGLTFMDSDIVGLCTDYFGIKGLSHTIGGASASGQLAIIQGIHLLESGQLDVCIVLGALMDLSFWECQGFKALGAMGSDQYANQPDKACRPFDQGHDGFIYGENCGALVIERSGEREKSAYAMVEGFGSTMDANRNANPSIEGEAGAIAKALNMASVGAGDVDYVNPHGTGSPLGDAVELSALRACGLEHVMINTTKSIIGHGLSAAGIVEVIATVLQMDGGILHPSRNLTNPIEENWNWVRQSGIAHRINRAITMSMGFGGINTALCIRNIY